MCEVKKYADHLHLIIMYQCIRENVRSTVCKLKIEILNIIEINVTSLYIQSSGQMPTAVYLSTMILSCFGHPKSSLVLLWICPPSLPSIYLLPIYRPIFPYTLISLRIYKNIVSGLPLYT